MDIKNKIEYCLFRLDYGIEHLRSHYEAEKVALPNKVSIDLFTKFLEEYFLVKDDHFRITPTIEEGVHISFKSNTKELYIEFYNTGEIAYLIDNSGMVTDIKELVNIVIKFIDGNG